MAAGGVEHGLDALTPRMNPGVCALRSSIKHSGALAQTSKTIAPRVIVAAVSGRLSGADRIISGWRIARVPRVAQMSVPTGGESVFSLIHAELSESVIWAGVGYKS